MMNRRTKFRKSLLHSHSQQTLNKLMAIEKNIITSHINEHSHEEAIAVAKIKEVPNFFVRYANRFSITKQEIGPFYSDNGSLTNDTHLFVNYHLNSLIVHSQYYYPIKLYLILYLSLHYPMLVTRNQKYC